MTQKPLVLAVETSGKIGSVTIALGEKILGETFFSGPMRHSSEIFPAIVSLLDRFSRHPREIEHVYISVGPGSFTGLRIAVALAKTMHLANAAKIVAVDTLDAIAANVSDYIQQKSASACHPQQGEESIDKIATIVDAKRGQFFIAGYRLHHYHTGNTKYEKILPDSLMTPSQFLERFTDPTQPVWLLGEGLVYHKDLFKTESVHFLENKYWNPRAEKVHSLGWKKAQAGQFADPLTLQPTYLRRPEAEEKWQQHNTKPKQ